MVRQWKKVLAGVAALAALVGAAACGLPDAAPAVEKMREEAAHRGLEGQVRYMARSIGGLGTSPHAVVEGWDATPGEARRLLQLLQENQRTAEKMRAQDLGVTVSMSVAGTGLELRTVPGDDAADLLFEVLAHPDVRRVSLSWPDNLEVQGEAGSLLRLAPLVPRVGEGFLRLSTAGREDPDVRFTIRPDAPLTQEGTEAILRDLRAVQEAVTPMRLAGAWVDATGPELLSVRHGTFDPQLFARLPDVVDPGVRLMVDAGEGHLHAVIGGRSTEPAGSEAEERLRAVVEK